MTKSTHTIKANELEAIALAASTEQTRYYLNGVCVETYADNSCGLVATDGHRLHAINTQDAPTGSFILGNDDIKKILSMYRAELKTTAKTIREHLVIVITHENGALTLSVMLGDKACGSFVSAPVDGQFPDWRRTVPSGDCESGPVGFNAMYLADFGKASKLLGHGLHGIVVESTSSSGPARIRAIGCPAFAGVCMPMRF